MERNEIIYNILIPSLQRLYEVDYFNISNGVSERNICARLAHHMENIMHEFVDCREYFADVEYNRKNDGTGKYGENKQKVARPMVSDLIVHRRSEDESNLMAIEMKRWNNYDKRDSDRERLESVVSSPKISERKKDCVYDTSLGAFIIYSPTKLNIELYEKDIYGRGQKSGELSYVFDGAIQRLIDNSRNF